MENPPIDLSRTRPPLYPVSAPELLNKHRFLTTPCLTAQILMQIPFHRTFLFLFFLNRIRERWNVGR